MNNEEEYKETELGLLPKEWRVVTLGNMDLFKILGSGINKFEGKKDYLSTTSIHINKIKEIECSINFKNRPSRANMQPIMNSVWFAKMKNTNKVYSFTAENKDEIEKYILSTGFCGILCKTEVDPIFLRMVFISDYFNKLKDTLSHGTTQQAVNTDDIKSICFPLPLPLEQKRIAFVLSSIEKSKEKTQNLINSLKELKKSAMKHLFTYGAVSFDDKDKIELKETEIGMMPKNWEIDKFSNLMEFSKKPRELKFNDLDEITFIPMEKISECDNPVRYEIKKYKDIASGTFVCKGDLIISKITPCFENGKQAILDKIPSNYAIATTEVIPVHPIGDRANTNFIYYLLKYLPVRKYLISKMQGTTGRKRLPKDALENLETILPTPQEQQKIANILSSIDEKIETEEKRVSALEQLFKSLLHNLMSGKVRVKDLKMEVING